MVSGYPSGSLRAAYERSGLSPWGLYVARYALGGWLGPLDLEAAVLGLLTLDDREWAVAAQALDDHSRDHGLPDRVLQG